MERKSFPEDFLWGTATAAYQIEGADFEEGKGPSIWTDFSHRQGRIFSGHNGDIACNHYYRYSEDISLMRELGVNAYRFSVSWPRVLPAGSGRINRKGLDFYSKLVDELLESRITPLVTLYHWDLPLSLQEKIGGWESRDIVNYFGDYASVVFEALGDRAKLWITLNEPFCSSHLSYLWGEHAPGKKDPRLSFIVAHNLLLSHGEGVRRFRETVKNGKIGLSNVSSHAEAISGSQEDLFAAKLRDQFVNGWFFLPPVSGEYPQELFERLDSYGIAPEILPGDMDLISTPLDFWGVNYYTRSIVRAEESELLGYSEVSGDLRKTEMGWEIFPKGLERFLIKAHAEYGNRPIYITENGMAARDRPVNGRVEDLERIAYLRDHIQAAGRALESGVDLRGYFVWSLLDNFEWAHGYSKRFGLIYVDFSDGQRRLRKDSYEFYRRFLNY